MVIWKGRTLNTTPSVWKGKSGNQVDRGFLTDDLGNVLADNTLNKIIFHTGVFVIKKSKWKNAR